MELKAQISNCFVDLLLKKFINHIISAKFGIGTLNADIGAIQ